MSLTAAMSAPAAMAETLTSPKGMNDLLPPDSAKWQHLEGACRELFARFGYGEARPPVVEHTELFSRGVGEALMRAPDPEAKELLGLA